MLRKIILHGSLKKANNNRSTIVFDVDYQNQLFAFLRARSVELNMALRKHDRLAIWTTNEAGEEIESVAQGFNFGNAPIIHVAPHTEGAYFIPALVWVAIAAVVVSVATTMLMSHMNTQTNGAGGSKSTMFNGITNDTDQGGAIPIPYGKRLIVGSTVIATDEDYVNLI